MAGRLRKGFSKGRSAKSRLERRRLSHSKKRAKKARSALTNPRPKPRRGEVWRGKVTIRWPIAIRLGMDFVIEGFEDGHPLIRILQLRQSPFRGKVEVHQVKWSAIQWRKKIC